MGWVLLGWGVPVRAHVSLEDSSLMFNIGNCWVAVGVCLGGERAPICGCLLMLMPNYNCCSHLLFALEIVFSRVIGETEWDG